MGWAARRRWVFIACHNYLCINQIATPASEQNDSVKQCVQVGFFLGGGLGGGVVCAFVSLCLRFCVCVLRGGWRGKLRGCSSPADSCLTAVAGGRGEAVKEQLNKPSDSVPHVARPDRPGRAGGVRVYACARGNVRHHSQRQTREANLWVHSAKLGIFLTHNRVFF